MRAPQTPREELLAVLEEARALVARAGNDFVWSDWEGPTDALAEIDELLLEVRLGATPVGLLSYLFAPTGSLQEVSLGSGWSDAYLALAARFDAVLPRVVGERR